MAVDWDALVLAPNFDIFAEPATFIPAGGGVITTFGGAPNLGRGVFDQGNKDVEGFSGELPTRTEVPTLGIRLSEFSRMPDENDRVYIASVDATYIVKGRPIIDGKGGARLQLNLAG